MAEGCDYANARVRAMRSRLLGRAGIAALLAEPGLAARLEFLKRTDYGEAVTAHLGSEADRLAATERALRARLMDDLAHIDRFLAGARVRALFRSILAFEDGWTIKTILRGVAAGEAPERMFLLLAPAAMSVHDVSRGRWAQVLEQFSRSHRGWLTRVTRVGRGPELLSSTGWHPLDSITVAPAEAQVTEIRVGFRNAPPVTVSTPRALAVDRRENGAARALEIDAAGGEFVRVVFRATARADELDGVAPAELEQSWPR